jgi:phage terminase large subunit-like protein
MVALRKYLALAVSIEDREAGRATAKDAVNLGNAPDLVRSHPSTDTALRMKPPKCPPSK